MYKYSLKREWSYLLYGLTYKNCKNHIEKAYEYHNMFIRVIGMSEYGYEGHRVVNDLKYFKDTYSPTRLSHIEITGYLIPIHVFDEVEI